MTCPICSKPTDLKTRPFCSKRCANVDLGKWLTGSYAIPSDDLGETEEPIVVPRAEARKQH